MGSVTRQLKYRVKWLDDDSPDLSFLGEFTNSPSGPYYVDRRLGLLLGEELPEPECPDDEIDLTDEQYDATLATLTAYAAWEEQPHEVLADVGREWECGEKTCWEPCNHTPLGSGWAHVTDEEVKAVLLAAEADMRRFDVTVPAGDFDRTAATQALDCLYIAQDYRRHETYGQLWSMTGCVVTLVVDETEVDTASLWGIESDCGQEYRDSIVDTLKAELQSQLPQTAQHYAEIAQVLASGEIETGV